MPCRSALGRNPQCDTLGGVSGGGWKGRLTECPADGNRSSRQRRDWTERKLAYMAHLAEAPGAA